MKYHKILKKNYPHGIMFHHFHDNKKHKSGQGTINEKQFKNIINFVGKKNILDAKDFLKFFKSKDLKKNHLCLTFDDTNPTQVDIALPILKKLKIKAFFFLNTAPIKGNFDKLELYRFFRNNYFKNVNVFYDNFYNYTPKNVFEYLKKSKKKILFKKKIYPHYTYDDIKFRLVRSNFLKKKDYDRIMFKMFRDFKFDPKKSFNKIFVSYKHIRAIIKEGHTIGLHSHNHPIRMNKLTYNQQFYEYNTNLKILCDILKKPKHFFNSMSHPCGSFNNDTFKVLKKLNIEIGFIERMVDVKINGCHRFKVPRQDHSDILSMMKS